MEDKAILADINRTIMSSPDLRSKKTSSTRSSNPCPQARTCSATGREYIVRKKQEEFERIVGEEREDGGWLSSSSSTASRKAMSTRTASE